MDGLLSFLVGKLPYDTQLMRVMFMLTVLASAITSIGGFTMVLITVKDNVFNYVFVCCCITYILLQFICLGILIFTKWFQLMFFCMLLNIYLVAVAGHFLYFQPGGILAGSIIIFLPFINSLAAFQGNTLQKILWVIIIVVTYISLFCADFFMSAVPEKETLLRMVFFPYFCLSFLAVSITAIIWWCRSTIERTDRQVETFGDAILNLDFKKESIINLLNKNPNRMTKFERLLRTIIKNISVYIKYLPEHFKHASENASSMQSTGSGRSSSIDLSDVEKQTTAIERSTNFDIMSRGAVIVTIYITVSTDGNKDILKYRLTNVLDCVTNHLFKFNGSLYVMLCDRIICCFNTEKICVDNALKAADFATAIKRDIPEAVITLKKMPVLFGNLNGKTQNIFITMLPPEDVLYETAKRTMSPVICGVLRAEIYYYYITREVDSNVFKICCRRNVCDNNDKIEWNYQIGDVLEEVLTEYDHAWEAFRNNDVEQARSLISSFLINNPNDADAIYFNKLVT